MGSTKLLVVAALAAIPSLVAVANEDVSVRIAKWKGDAKGAVSLYYDDGTDSSFRNAVPELVRRGLPGTFYICCGWYEGENDPKLARWGTAAREHPDAIFLGDHTWTHGGVTNAAQFAGEISRNGAMLRRLSGLPEDAPLSFAIPGVAGWKISREELDKTLAEHHEVLRHRFEPNIGGPKDGTNPVFSMRTAADAAQAFNRAEAEGGWESLIFHGVGGDWIAFDLEEHGKMLDDLETRAKADRLWVGSAIDVHAYERIRETARIKDVEISGEGLDFKVEGVSWRESRVKVGGSWHKAQIPGPTLVCAVPKDWTRARVRATRNLFGSAEMAKIAREGFVVPVAGGRLVFDLPVGWVGVSVRKAD